MNPPWKSLWMGFEKLRDWCLCWCREWYDWREGVDSPHIPFLHTLPYAFLPSGYSWVIFFCNKTVIQLSNVLLSSVSHSRKLIKSRERVIGTRSVVSQKHRYPAGLMIGVWSEQQSCGTAPVACGIWCSLRVDSVRIELNYTLAGVEEFLDVWRNQAPPQNTHIGIGIRTHTR